MENSVLNNGMITTDKWRAYDDLKTSSWPNLYLMINNIVDNVLLS